MSETMTPRQAADRMGVSVSTVYQYLNKGRLPGAYKDEKGRWQILEDAIAEPGVQPAPGEPEVQDAPDKQVALEEPGLQEAPGALDKPAVPDELDTPGALVEKVKPDETEVVEPLDEEDELEELYAQEALEEEASLEELYAQETLDEEDELELYAQEALDQEATLEELYAQRALDEEAALEELHQDWIHLRKGSMLLDCIRHSRLLCSWARSPPQLDCPWQVFPTLEQIPSILPLRMESILQQDRHQKIQNRHRIQLIRPLLLFYLKRK